jgi:diacylglycerol kinase (ATP)
LQKYLFYFNFYLVDLRWIKFDVIYYEYGAMVIVYDDPDKAVRTYKTLRDSFFDDKQLTVLLLPTIQVDLLICNNIILQIRVNQ